MKFAAQRKINEKNEENFCKRLMVWLSWSGWYWRFTPRRYPITACHEDFWLLGFPSGPVRLSLANLITSDSSIVTILMASLMRTPCQHEPSNTQNSQPQISPKTRPLRRQITEDATFQSNVNAQIVIHLLFHLKHAECGEKCGIWHWNGCQWRWNWLWAF